MASYGVIVKWSDGETNSVQLRELFKQLLCIHNFLNPPQHFGPGQQTHPSNMQQMQPGQPIQQGQNTNTMPNVKAMQNNSNEIDIVKISATTLLTFMTIGPIDSCN